MVPVVAEIALENKDTFVVAKLDIDESPKKAQEYNAIRVRPTFIVFQDGEAVGRFRGEMPKADLLRNILSVIDVEEN